MIAGETTILLHDNAKFSLTKNPSRISTLPKLLVRPNLKLVLLRDVLSFKHEIINALNSSNTIKMI